MPTTFEITCIDTDMDHKTVFSQKDFPKNVHGGMLLTDRIDAQNFRLRESDPGYQAEWHMAGDPTLIIVQQGTLRIELRDGSHKDFNAGDMFIAQDNLPEGVSFETEKHGHRASVIGNEKLRAVHIKLGRLN